MHGGEWVAKVLEAQGVAHIFTLAGGHISPILVAAKQRGIRVVDVRHEVNAVFAADAVARLTGIPGVAVVTAGPGVTNCLTAVKNAQMAQSPLVLLGGAAATMLQGRGALQDIDQLSLFDSVVKWSRSVRRCKDIVSTLERAFKEALSGTPGPVFVELPIDLLYEKELVTTLYDVPKGRSLRSRLLKMYVSRHLRRLFHGAERQQVSTRVVASKPRLNVAKLQKVARALNKAQRPVFIIGSQALNDIARIRELIAALEQIQAPVYLSSMARGLLGKNHPLHLRHQRRAALKEADFVLLAGVPCDFRLDYGRHIRSSCFHAAISLSRVDATRNKKPDVAVIADPSETICHLAQSLGAQIEMASKADTKERWRPWRTSLRERDEAREQTIGQDALTTSDKLNPLALCQALEAVSDKESILIADGGDFVATASYITRAPGPLTWLDPGPFGTLGVGAGFALGAKLVRPDANVWIIYGDGSVGYSLIEFDSFHRHQLGVVAVVGNDAAWTQIAREQVKVFHDGVSTELLASDYHRAAEALGAKGMLLEQGDDLVARLQEAKAAASYGQAILVNAILAKSGFREGSLSV